MCFNFILFGVAIYNYVLLPLLELVHGGRLELSSDVELL